MSDFPTTAQGIFDKVADHLVRQGVPARGKAPEEAMLQGPVDEEVCLYRGPNGTSCAFGCLIPDSRYSPTLENVTARTLIEGNAETGHGPVFPELKPFMTLIDDLQLLHDDDESWVGCNLIHNLRHVAIKHGLSTKVFQ